MQASALSLALALLLHGSAAGAAQFSGDAASFGVRSLAATNDGGWIAVGTDVGSWPRDGLVLRADASDRVIWALRATGTPLLGVAPLPDGGALVSGARGLISRVDAGGSTAWSAEVGDGDAGVQALSCRGWDCVATGDSRRTGFLIRLDALTGAVTWEVDTASASLPVSPTAVLLLAGGDVLLGCTVDEDGLATAASVRFDPTGALRWAWRVTGSWWTDAPNTQTYPGVRALAEWPDGRTLAVAENAYTEPTLLAQAADGLPLASLDWNSSLAESPTSAAILPSGNVLLGSGRGSRVTLVDAALTTLDAVQVGERGGGMLLAATSVGDAVVIAWPNVGRLALDLSATDGCITSAPAAFPKRWVADPPNAAAMSLAFPERDVFGLGPSSVMLVPACLGDPCLIPCESNCLDDLDGDGDFLIDCQDSDCALEPACAGADPDDDGAPNLTDCRPGDGLVSSTPSGLMTLTVRKLGPRALTLVLEWHDPSRPPPPRGEATADVLRGRLVDLLADRSPIGGTCVAPRRSGSGWWDVGAAAMGEDSWYLVRAWNACGPGPWDRSDLDAGLGGCP